MDLNAAAVFARVVETGSFAAAGAALAMPTTTVSRKVARLEGDLGVRLLNRTTRKVSTTEAGARAYAQVATALALMADAASDARASQSDPAGVLTVAAPGAIGVPFLLPAATAFSARHPSVRVTLLSINDWVDPAAGLVDVLIWADAALPAGYRRTLVGRVEIGLYATADYLARCGVPRLPGDLAVHDSVGFTQAMVGGRFAWRLLCSDAAITVVPLRPPGFCSNDAAAILAATCAGLGIGALPRRLAETAAGPPLVRVLPDLQPPPIELGALYRDGGGASARTRLFLDFTTRWFRDQYRD